MRIEGKQRHLDGYEEEEYSDPWRSGPVFIGQCEATLVWGPEIDERDTSWERRNYVFEYRHVFWNYWNQGGYEVMYQADLLKSCL
jgi:hypothetical protein